MDWWYQHNGLHTEGSAADSRVPESLERTKARKKKKVKESKTLLEGGPGSGPRKGSGGGKGSSKNPFEISKRVDAAAKAR